MAEIWPRREAGRGGSGGSSAPDIRRLLAYRRPNASQATVDVVMPVYGSRGLALQAIDSVLAAATRESFELVVVDDASPFHCCGANCSRWQKPA